jgi:uncharacterized protein YjbI with pentapeptide repeats
MIPWFQGLAGRISQVDLREVDLRGADLSQAICIQTRLFGQGLFML